jgi:hypothetical protein
MLALLQLETRPKMGVSVNVLSLIQYAAFDGGGGGGYICCE